MASHVIGLALGGAECLWPDIREAEKLIDPADCIVAACNDAGFEWPHRLDLWASMHAEELPVREQIRRRRGYPNGYRTVTRPYPFGMKDREALCDIVIGGWHGSSGLLTVGALYEAGARRIMLCGIPLDERPHFNRPSAFGSAAGYRARWLELYAKLAPTVRSFSGWTRATFGAPTEEWLTQRISYS